MFYNLEKNQTIMKTLSKLLIILALTALCARPVSAQPERPKLVVGIVIDQMRWDYLMRYQNRYCEGGFKRLMREGFSCDNCMINYIPTITAVGHASVFTGTFPSVHGIVGNSFRIGYKWVGCVEDTTVIGVGTTGKQGKVSPRNMMTTTFADELRLATNFRSKTIGVSIKDRGAILPAGHTANGAYWYDNETGNFISSTFYADKLPDWVNKFNERKLADKYLSQKWEPLYPIETYTQSTADDAPYEGTYVKGQPTVFPIDVPEAKKSWGYGLMKYVPAGATITFDIAKAALEGEQLGKGSECDILTVSISTTDGIGHHVGINAAETEDCYLRLDRDLADFLTTLDKHVGEGNYIVFLTADHGAAHNISFNQDHRIPSQPWDMGKTTRALNKYLQQHYGTDRKLIFGDSNCQIILQRDVISELGINADEVIALAIEFLKKDQRFAYVAELEKMNTAPVPQPIRDRAINGYNRLRSGDITTIPQPAIYGDAEQKLVKGTTHGVWNPYDAHIPCLFMGWHIPKGKSSREVHMTDIAPTICNLLSIQMPNGCTGQPIEFR